MGNVRKVGEIEMRIQTFHASTYARVCQICEEIKDLAVNYGNESEVKLLANEIVELMDFNRMMKMHLEHAKEEADRGDEMDREAKWIHREDMDFIDKYNCNHFHGMCTNCGLVHDFIDGHTGQYLYCPQCGRSVKWE